MTLIRIRKDRHRYGRLPAGPSARAPLHPRPYGRGTAAHFGRIVGVGQAWAAIGILGGFAAAVLGIVFRELRGLRGEIGGLRGEMHTELGQVRGEIGELRGEMRDEFGQMRGEIGGLDQRLTGEIGRLGGELRGEIGGLRSDLSALSDRVATMDGKLDVVVGMAHTHSAA